jgi:hypothetical protein
MNAPFRDAQATSATDKSEGDTTCSVRSLISAELVGRLRLTDLTLRIQQMLKALDIFQAAAGLPIVRVTEMLHPWTF